MIKAQKRKRFRKNLLKVQSSIKKNISREIRYKKKEKKLSSGILKFRGGGLLKKKTCIQKKSTLHKISYKISFSVPIRIKCVYSQKVVRILPYLAEICEIMEKENSLFVPLYEVMILSKRLD